MKITRLKSGFRISCNDSEFEALLHLVEYGKADLADTEHRANLSPGAKAAMTRYFDRLDAMRVDDDRRLARLAYSKLVAE